MFGDYDQLHEYMVIGPQIIALLEKRSKSWVITICENWNEDIYFYPLSDDIDKRIEWTQDQLKNWKFVSRQSYDQWFFKRKIDAERFITLFNLKWAN